MKPQTNHNNASGTREVPQDVLSDIEDIVNYLIVDELEHCRARGNALDAAPILPSLANVKGWLERKPRDVNWWLRHG